MTLLRVEELTKFYGEAQVLDRISLEVEAGDVVCLIGSSGSGKSTLLRCLNRLEPVDDGVIWFDGEDITDPRTDERALRAQMGMVFQSYNLFPHMSVMKNLLLAPRKVHRMARGEAEQMAHELLAKVGLAGFENTHPDRMSGGQQQRVALARALMCRPKMLLLDEVTSALDPELVGELLHVLRELAAGGTTMILATHEMAFAREVATSVCFLHQGAIIESGPPSKVLGDPSEPRTRQFLSRVLSDG